MLLFLLQVLVDCCFFHHCRCCHHQCCCCCCCHHCHLHRCQSATLFLSHLTVWLLLCLLSHRPLIVLSLRQSHRLALAGCCIASCRATLLLCRSLILSLSSHCATLLLSHLTGWLLRCLLSHHPLVVLSLHHSFVVLRQLIVALPLTMPPSCPLVVPPSCPLVVLYL